MFALVWPRARDGFDNPLQGVDELNQAQRRLHVKQATQGLSLNHNDRGNRARGRLF